MGEFQLNARTSQPVIAVDFDGTLFNEDSDGNLIPAHGAREAMINLANLGCYIIIHTCRMGLAAERGFLGQELKTVRDALDRFSIPYNEIYLGPKLVADIYIDDRAIGFAGRWETTLNAVTRRLETVSK